MLCTTAIRNLRPLSVKIRTTSFDNQMTRRLHPKSQLASPIFCRQSVRNNMWMRSCVVCKALLSKLRLSDSTRCQCVVGPFVRAVGKARALSKDTQTGRWIDGKDH